MKKMLRDLWRFCASLGVEQGIHGDNPYVSPQAESFIMEPKDLGDKFILQQRATEISLFYRHVNGDSSVTAPVNECFNYMQDALKAQGVGFGFSKLTSNINIRRIDFSMSSSHSPPFRSKFLTPVEFLQMVAQSFQGWAQENEVDYAVLDFSGDVMVFHENKQKPPEKTIVLD